jgi:putative nucleotidyltransferase with HDIG domain
MSLYRIKQFYWSITARISIDDNKYIKKYLNEREINLFNKLAVLDQKHSINVATDVENYCKIQNIKNNMLIKAALLHDIGKSEYKSNVLNKTIMVLLDKITRGKVKKYKNIRMINTYYNHGVLGYNILKDYGYEEKLLYLIKNHHNTEIKENLYLDILKKSDNNN